MSDLNPEGLERAAEALWNRADHDNMWGDADHDALCPDLRNDYRSDAYASITAYLGHAEVTNMREAEDLPNGAVVLAPGPTAYLRGPGGWVDAEARVWLTPGWDFPMRVLYRGTPDA